ncbi:hypothetical protein [Pseudomonas sp. BN515]|uniref:hypothetical protein n=1 Tax=Pseudomonas sp. BN515 TaxID=2567892 RepID=UPI00245690B2|nr:hypothetical protein [Pseudomonas sp. BN515]MDH4871991.1 hypothetical protein [Pseudomonas sp. BN515]
METQQLLEAVQTIQVIKTLFTDKPNEWLPVVAAIGGAFVGGVSTFFPAHFVEHFKNKREAKAIEIALISEISAILTIAEHRDYLGGFREVVEYLKKNPDARYKYTVRIPDHYSRVYQGHVDRIGKIAPPLSSKIIEFHQLIDAIVQDISPDGLIQEEGGDLETFEELLMIYGKALDIGMELTGRG